MFSALRDQQRSIFPFFAVIHRMTGIFKLHWADNVRKVCGAMCDSSVFENSAVTAEGKEAGLSKSWGVLETLQECPISG